MDCYDRFLDALDDEGTRTALEGTSFDEAPESSKYNELRELSHAYRDGIEELFFDLDPSLARLIRKVGVF